VSNTQRCFFSLLISIHLSVDRIFIVDTHLWFIKVAPYNKTRLLTTGPTSERQLEHTVKLLWLQKEAVQSDVNYAAYIGLHGYSFNQMPIVSVT